MRWMKAKRLCLVAVVAAVSAAGWCSAQESGTAAVAPTIPPMVVHLNLSGQLGEAPSPDSFGLMPVQSSCLKNLIDRMEQVRADDRITAVVLTFDGMSVGSAQAEEIRRAIQALRKADKKVYVHAGSLQTAQYALLCGADRMSVAPESSLWLTGLYGESFYLKGLLDKIGVRADFLHMGDYKSAPETLMQTGPSAAAEENTRWLMDGQFSLLVDTIASSRGKKSAEVRDLIDQAPFMAEEAVKKGLIDAVETREEFIAQVKKDLGGQATIDNRYGEETKTQMDLSNPMALFAVLGEMFKPAAPKAEKPAVALIYVEGTIQSGYGRSDLFGLTRMAYSGNISRALKTAAEDDSIKAVVIRVDSPGGSSEASEIMLHAAQMVQAAKKPLIVSMGNVAASGGYYLSCGADAVFADKATVTGSIGIFGGKIVTADMWAKLGVNWVGHARGTNADIMASTRPFDERQRNLMTAQMQSSYDTFKKNVEAGRGKRLRKPIDEVAGGRVFTGEQALGLGLIDEIGGLQQAIEKAAAGASLTDYEVRIMPEPKDFLTGLFEDFSGEKDRPSDVSLSAVQARYCMTMLTRDAALSPFLGLLEKAEPERARALRQALLQMDLIRQESVIMMMPCPTLIMR